MPVDFHSHILPGIDDGSANIPESIAMLKLEAEQGVTQVVATPHFYPETDSPDRFLQRRNAAYARLMEAIGDQPNLPEILLGAEVAYFRGISNCEILSSLQIGNTRHVLIEMPYERWSDYAYRELEELGAKQGLTPIIAHVDRYLDWINTNSILKRLSELPVLLQVSSGYFLQPTTKGKALRMLRKGQVHLLGSDCHNLTDRVPNLGDAIARIQKKLGDKALAYIQANEDSILG